MPPAISSLPLWAQLALIVVPSASAIFAGIGLLLNAAQARRSGKQARAAIVSESLSAFSACQEMRRAFYAIEYSRFIYDEAFHDSEVEKDVDRLLQHFSNLALAWQAGLLKRSDLQQVEYYVRRIMRNSGIREYISFVEDWSNGADIGQHPYVALVKLGKALDA